MDYDEAKKSLLNKALSSQSELDIITDSLGIDIELHRCSVFDCTANETATITLKIDMDRTDAIKLFDWINLLGAVDLNEDMNFFIKLKRAEVQVEP